MGTTGNNQWSVTDQDHLEFLSVCEEMLEKDQILSEAAEASGLTRSTVWYRIEHWVRYDDPVLYGKLRDLLYDHKGMFLKELATKYNSLQEEHYKKIVKVRKENNVEIFRSDEEERREFVKSVRELILEQNFTHEDLADYFGVSRGAIQYRIARWVLRMDPELYDEIKAHYAEQQYKRRHGLS